MKVGNFKKVDVVYDLYCGTGTIGIYISSYVKKVYGIEIVEDAIEDAKFNAEVNGVENIFFYASDIKDSEGTSFPMTFCDTGNNIYDDSEFFYDKNYFLYKISPEVSAFPFRGTFCHEKIAGSQDRFSALLFFPATL